MSSREISRCIFYLLEMDMKNRVSRELMAQSPYQKNFHLLGYRKDSQNILAMSDGLVLPSTHGES
jgi:hypothetical protein